MLQNILERNQAAERLIARLEGRGIGLWTRGQLLSEDLHSNAPGVESRNLPTYHSFIRWKMELVLQRLQRAGGAGPQRMRAVSAAASAAAAAASDDVPEVPVEMPSVRAPLDPEFNSNSQAAAAAAAPPDDGDDAEDAEAVNQIMELQQAPPPSSGAASQEAQQFPCLEPDD